MRNIKYIVVHCTDTLSNAEVKVIQKNWIKKGWKAPGYHYIIKADGEIVKLLDEKKNSNGVLNYNDYCINICYIGGRTATKKCVNTMTRAQENSLFDKIVELTEKYPQAEIRGHCEFDGQGGRTCPNFNVKEWVKNYTPDIENL